MLIDQLKLNAGMLYGQLLSGNRKRNDWDIGTQESEFIDLRRDVFCLGSVIVMLDTSSEEICRCHWRALVGRNISHQ